ncbi:MAG TPA: PAS domain S-box protein [Roseateles sp.]
MRPELESIYQTAPIGLAVLDTDLRFLRVNERLAEMNGLLVEDHIGRSIGEILPDLAEQAEALLRRVLETGRAIRDLEVSGETPACPGVVRIWREQITPLRDEDGTITRLSVVAEEITDQRRAEETLRNSRQTLELAMDAARQAMWEWNIATDQLSFNGNWNQVLGYGPEDVVNTRHGWLSLVMAADRDRADACMDAFLHGRALSYDCEYRMLHAGGGWVWIAVQGKVVERDEEGRPLRMIGVAKDVTAERRDREELQQLAQLLQLAFDGIFVWTREKGIEFWNHGAELQYGYTAAEAYGRHPNDLLKTEFPCPEAQKDGALEAEGLWRGELSHLTKGGRRITVNAVMQRVGNDRERVLEMTHDITERKQTEQALQEVDARRTEFLAMLAHELRNPLSPITNAVHLLERMGDNRERRETLTQILRRQTAHLSRLVDDLLEGSRITQGRIELRMENVLVATSVFQAVEAARPLARERGQSIKVKVPPELDLVADPARLTQIVSNLVTNAVKYTPEGGHIVVMVHAGSDEELSIVVQDNGPGVTAELQPRLFELFTQDRRTLDRSQGGLGIGLALVKRLTELHGGSVRHETPKSGTGSRFVVCLPRTGKRDGRHGRSAAACAPVLPPLSMLVVDDNVDAADTLATLLRMDGQRVEQAYDGEQALAKAASQRPHVVMLDLGLPKLNGLEVARRLRADARLKSAVLIAMSGYAQAADKQASAAAGFDEHLAKPVDLADLYCAIEAHLPRGAL